VHRRGGRRKVRHGLGRGRKSCRRVRRKHPSFRHRRFGRWRRRIEPRHRPKRRRNLVRILSNALVRDDGHAHRRRERALGHPGAVPGPLVRGCALVRQRVLRDADADSSRLPHSPSRRRFEPRGRHRAGSRWQGRTREHGFGRREGGRVEQIVRASAGAHQGPSWNAADDGQMNLVGGRERPLVERRRHRLHRIRRDAAGSRAKKGLELRDCAELPRRGASAGKDVVARDHISRDRPLQLPKRRKHEGAALSRRDHPSVRFFVRPHIAAHSELVTTAGALDGGPLLADERVIEIVLGLAALALDVHIGCRSF